MQFQWLADEILPNGWAGLKKHAYLYNVQTSVIGLTRRKQWISSIGLPVHHVQKKSKLTFCCNFKSCYFHNFVSYKVVCVHMLGEVATFYTTLTVNHSLLQLEWMPNFMAIYKQVLKQKKQVAYFIHTRCIWKILQLFHLNQMRLQPI